MKSIGIVVAMDEEREAIKELMTNTEIIQIYNLKFIKGNIQGKECILIKSGVGKVNSARTTQVLISNFEIEYVINVGAAGAVNWLLNIGDVIVAKHVVQHDFDITAFGHSKGYITGVGAFIESDAELLEEFSEIFDYYFTNREIYVHKVLENETSDINLENDYYLAPLSDADNTLYPYMYDENTQSYQLVENGVTDSEGNILFASGYNGKYVYSDLCPIISGVSGALFTFDSENNAYTVLEDAKSSLNDCFLIDKQPFKIDGFEEAPTFTLTLDENSDLSTLDADYAFVDTMNAIIYNGTINVTFTDLNNISLDDIINQ